MDRLKELRESAGVSEDSTLDITSPPSEAFMTANESSSKFYSLSEMDSTFDISEVKDVSVPTTAADVPEATISSPNELRNISPIGKKSDIMDSYKIGKQIEAANILSGGVEIFEDNDNSYDGDELIIDDNVEIDEKCNSQIKQVESLQFKSNDIESTLVNEEADIGSKDSEVVLQIDGKNVDAIDIGNGLYLYRKEGEEELAAVQIIDDGQQQPSFKFLKVRENTEGNLEVYEEIQIEIPKELPLKQGNTADKNALHVPKKDISRVFTEAVCNKTVERNNKMEYTSTPKEIETEMSKDTTTETKTDVNFNGKMVKFTESRKSPVIGSKEGKPLTKIMVDQQLHPNRHSDNVKKTIEVHTDISKQRANESLGKNKEETEDNKLNKTCTEKEIIVSKMNEKHVLNIEEKDQDVNEDQRTDIIDSMQEKSEDIKITDQETENKTLNNLVTSADVKMEEKMSNPIVNVNIKKASDKIVCVTGQEVLVDQGILKDALSIDKVYNSEPIHTKAKNIINENNVILTVMDIDSLNLESTKETTVVSTCNVEDITNDNQHQQIETNIGIIRIEDKIIAEPIKAKEITDTEQKTIVDDHLTEIIKEVNIIDQMPEKTNPNEITSSQCVSNIVPKISHEKELLQKESRFPTKQIINEDVTQIGILTSSKILDETTKSIENKGNFQDLDVTLLNKVSDKSRNKIIETIPIETSDGVMIKVLDKSSQLIKSDSNLRQSKNDKISASKHINTSIATNKLTIDNMQKPNTNKLQEKGPIQEVNPTSLNVQKIENIPVVVTSTPLKAVVNSMIKNTKVELNTVPKVELNVISKHIQNNSESNDGKEVFKISPEPKQTNSHAAVPFGKWTDANRQEFLNKFKAKAPAISSNSNQIKNSNDLNRRDVLKKIDSQRQSSNLALSKIQDASKLAIKNEAFGKTNIIPEDSKIPVKIKAPDFKVTPVDDKTLAKLDKDNKTQTVLPAKNTTANVLKKETKQRTEVIYQDLINKTIEDMLHRGVAAKISQDSKHNITNNGSQTPRSSSSYPQNYPPIDEVATLDAIEMKMNELHGIPFIERPPHELPQVIKSDAKVNTNTVQVEQEKPLLVNKINKLPNLLPYPTKNQQKVTKENALENDSEEEIIEHEPITGDIEFNIKNYPAKPLSVEKQSEKMQETIEKMIPDVPKKEAIITENDFDKFVRRNSITYENRITVNFDGKEPHNVIKTVIEKDMMLKIHSRSDIGEVEHKTKIPKKYGAVMEQRTNDESSNRNQSKLQKAYHSALTAKRQMDCPITIIEDKPVKVVFMDNMEFVSNQLNVQGQDLSPVKKSAPESDIITVGMGDSMDSEILNTVDDMKYLDETKVKTKHQRKQVLTPVDEPESELIEPTDLGIHVSPKKKRKAEEDKLDKALKYPMRKKIYMLTSSEVEEKQTNTQEVVRNPLLNTMSHTENISHNSTVSAIDNLVKAAALIETQTENATKIENPDHSSPDSTPVKRGRGRPRKYPLPDGVLHKNNVPSPQKKPRLIDAKPPKQYTTSDEEDSDGAIVRENWTMGKINENIVCPICNKLFRSENVVFKHVKHCTGPSPNRSDSDKRGLRRIRQSKESESDDMDVDDEKLSDIKIRKENPKKRISKDYISKVDTDEVIIIEDTPYKQKREKLEDRKQHESREHKSKIPHTTNDLVCEFCDKTFRQLSYLVSHKLQHNRKEDSKKTEKGPAIHKSVYSCEICKKEFRRLHHLVHHRIIHNPSPAPERSLRKSSSEQMDIKTEKELDIPKPTEDLSAGFRCEPCDKSFRKLHHLVEHRETHDGINRQKITTVMPNNAEKPVSLHTCEICKKTFKKLHHLIEHKEQHMDTGSEKSDDKSVKSSLSTKDIIHECSLCYMVFPNEHSLNKHTIICQRKKKQSKQKQTEGTKITDEVCSGPKMDADELENIELPKLVPEDIESDKSVKEEESQKKEDVLENIDLSLNKNDNQEVNEKENLAGDNGTIEVFTPSQHSLELTLKKNNEELDIKKDDVSTTPAKNNIFEKVTVKIRDTPKKKMLPKNKITPTVIKTPKVANAPVPIVETKLAVESSDDDEIRYMLNPNFKVQDTEEKIFMNVRARKRSSLQIEIPNSKILVKRRISLQHTPKTPRLKQKSIDATIAKNVNKAPKESVLSTDSDDSDVKYSFPKSIPKKISKSILDRSFKHNERKTPRKTFDEKRKSLSTTAKRKSLGKHKPLPMKQLKRRTVEVEHRCDCGQLFSSAALLVRHTSIAHTPPRIRRRRSPPPDQPPTRPAPARPAATDNHFKPKQSVASRKSSVRNDTSTSATNKKLNKSESKPKAKLSKGAKIVDDAPKSKPIKSPASSNVKRRKSGAHRGVPVPDKMRKLMQKLK